MGWAGHLLGRTPAALANDHIFAVRADPRGDCIWIGTEGGLSRYDKQTKKIRNWTEADGLPCRAITGIEVQPATGDVWLGLFGGGLARFSAGRFDHYHQLNSGLVNDAVYAVAIEGDNVWCATTAGASRFNTKTDKWDIYTDPDGEMEIDLYRDDGVPHVITTGASYVDKILWVSSYFGCARYDGRPGHHQTRKTT